MKTGMHMRKRFRDYSVRKKILIGTLAVAIVPMLLGYLLMIQIFNMSYRNNLKEEAEVTIEAATTSLEVEFHNIKTAMEDLKFDADIIESLQNHYGINDYKAYRAVYSITTRYGNLANFSIYDIDGKLHSSVSSNDYIKEKLPTDYGALYEALQYPTQCIIRNARIYHGQEKEEFLRMAMMVHDHNDRPLGFVVANVNSAHFDEILKSVGKEKRGIIYVMDDFRKVVFCSEQHYDENEILNAWRVFSGEEKIQTEVQYESLDGNYSFYAGNTKDNKFHVFYQQPVASLKSMRKMAGTIVISTGIAGILLCILLSAYFSNYFYRPLKGMQAALKEIQKGNFEVKLEVLSEDEFGQLAMNFNVMSEHMTENMESLLQRERELSEANIKMLQAQLNPHFLYNTLDTLKWLGKANQIPKVATLSSSLAQILRMSISAGPMIRLSEEMKIVSAYIEIQKIRFEDKFQFDFELPKGYEDCLVPKLILQPLVENSIIHGLSESENGIISISVCETENEDLQIQVKDNGKGMSEEKVTELNQNVRENKHTEQTKNSIGYYNVNAIIKLNYGEAYGLQAYAREGEGTTVVVLVPKKYV